jgi:GT2 family glycosyltransferase
MLIKREVIDKIGVFDEEYDMGYVDDADFSVRAIRAGYRCVMANNILVEHLRNATFLTLFNSEKIAEIQERNKRLFDSKWGKKKRILFIISSVKDRTKVSSLILKLARDQHNIHIWNTGKMLNVGHTNVREDNALPLFMKTKFSLEVRISLRCSHK